LIGSPLKADCPKTQNLWILSVINVEKLIGFPPRACGNDKLFLFSGILKHAGMTTNLIGELIF